MGYKLSTKPALRGIALAIAITSANAAPPPGGWTLTWSDEFNGTSIDSSKWSWGALPWGGQHHNNEYASWITPEDSYLSGGSLWLRCRKATGSEFGGYPYSEGFVHSNGKMNYTYGYVEIRARYPTGKGVWPAFWSLSSGWPPEFDIAEYFGSDNRMHMGLAYGTCCPANWNSSNFNEDFANWHTYGLEWGPGYAIWYKDGAVKKTIYASYVPTVPMYLILNSGMRYDADATTPFPNYYQVDYVRLYKLPNGPVPNGTYRVIARHSGKALDVSGGGTGNGADVIQWTYNGGNNQRWNITHLGNNQYKIIGVASAKALDVASASTADGANVDIWTYSGANHQRWILTATSGGYYSVRAVHSNKGLDVAGQSTADGANVQQWGYWGGNNQQWTFLAP
jgi:ricin-type beta-trefoil lectin protein/glycosyl hydrolase family 16